MDYPWTSDRYRTGWQVCDLPTYPGPQGPPEPRAIEAATLWSASSAYSTSGPRVQGVAMYGRSDEAWGAWLAGWPRAPQLRAAPGPTAKPSDWSRWKGEPCCVGDQP